MDIVLRKAKKEVVMLVATCSFLFLGLVGCALASKPATPKPQATKTMDELIVQFSSPDVRERADAMNWAGSYWNRPDSDKMVLLPYLVEALSDPESTVRMYAAQSIRQLGIYDQRAIDKIISWLDEKGHSSNEIVTAMVTIGAFAEHAPDATPGLIRMMMTPPFSSPWSVGQQTAAQTLASIGDPVAIPYLLRISLSPGESWMRRAVMIALAEYGVEAACTVPYLAPLLASPEADIRTGAAVVINEATESMFPGSKEWQHRVASGNLERNVTGEYVIVKSAREWWQTTGQHENWSVCPVGLDGQPVLLPGVSATTSP